MNHQLKYCDAYTITQSPDKRLALRLLSSFWALAMYSEVNNRQRKVLKSGLLIIKTGEQLSIVIIRWLCLTVNATNCRTGGIVTALYLNFVYDR